MSFKNHEELFRALLDGKSIRFFSWQTKSLKLINGNLVDNEGHAYIPTLDYPEQWEICEEPLKTRTVWQWRYYNDSFECFYVDSRLLAEEDVERWHKGKKYEKHAGPFEISL